MVRELKNNTVLLTKHEARFLLVILKDIYNLAKCSVDLQLPRLDDFFRISQKKILMSVVRHYYFAVKLRVLFTTPQLVGNKKKIYHLSIVDS